MFAFSLNSLFIAQVSLLILGPLTIVGAIAWIILFSNKASGTATNSMLGQYEKSDLVTEPPEQDGHEDAPTTGSRRHRILASIGWAKPWAALLVTTGLDVALVVVYVKVNPFVSLLWSVGVHC